jgi:hypothetical protein
MAATPLGGNGEPISVVFFHNSGMNDTDLENVVELLLHIGNVKTLSVHCGVTDSGVRCLARLQSLDRISLLGTSVTADGAEQLRAALPNCKVEIGYLAICGR